MVFSIENIGLIQKADIRLDGLTVIGGENDTGKSTIGKLLFAIVKGISRYEEDLNEGREKNVSALIENIYFTLRKLPINKDILEGFRLNNFVQELAPFTTSQNPLSVGYTLNDFISHKLDLIDYSNLPQKDKDLIHSKFNELTLLVTENEPKINTIKRAISRAFHSEFYSEISSKFNNKNAQLHLTEPNLDILKITLNKDEITNFELNDEILFNDVTFVETPILLQLYDVLKDAQTLLELVNEDKIGRISNVKPKVSLHIKDLITKLENAQYFSRTLFTQDKPLLDYIDSISETIGGGFSFDRDKRDFSFNKKNNGKGSSAIRPINTASGIKSFGIIQLLLQANMLDNRSLLILDEPETHLHPKWQIEYAKLIVELVKNNISVLITSHSPYMIQALKVYSEKGEIQDQTAFYLAEKDSKGHNSVFTDVTQNLNQLFQKLSEPLQQLVWQ